MHGLNTITRKNAEAFERAIQNFQAQGRFVMAKYEGLTLVSIETFSSANELVDAHAAAIAKPENVNTGTRFQCFQPIPAWHTAGRDQSEDRTDALAFAFACETAGKAPERTLGDYLSRRHGGAQLG